MAQRAPRTNTGQGGARAGKRAAGQAGDTSSREGLNGETTASGTLQDASPSVLRFSRCARSTPLSSLRCRRPFTARRTRYACVTPACAFPCPLRRSSRAAAPSRVAACAGPAARVLPARRRSAPAARARTCSGAGRGSRAAHTAAAARRTRARALPRRAAPPVRALGCGCGLLTAVAVLCSLAPCSQPSSLVATSLHERADHTRGALAARVRR
jgi:hypothetical protein